MIFSAGDDCFLASSLLWAKVRESGVCRYAKPGDSANKTSCGVSLIAISYLGTLRRIVDNRFDERLILFWGGRNCTPRFARQSGAFTPPQKKSSTEWPFGEKHKTPISTPSYKYSFRLNDEQVICFRQMLAAVGLEHKQQVSSSVRLCLRHSRCGSFLWAMSTATKSSNSRFVAMDVVNAIRRLFHRMNFDCFLVD